MAIVGMGLRGTRETTDMGVDRFEKQFDRKRLAGQDRAKGMPGADEEPLPPPVEPIKSDKDGPGRNDPCPCGSGKKFKQCCINK